MALPVIAAAAKGAVVASKAVKGAKIASAVSKGAKACLLYTSPSPRDS